MAALNLGVGLLVLLVRARAHAGFRWMLPIAATVAVLARSRAPLEFRFPSEGQGLYHRVLYYREGPSATPSVLFSPLRSEKSMHVDGVLIGGPGFTDYKQKLLAHLPKLLMDEVSPELSIGLGSGILVGESARHGRVRSITTVEIAPSVVEGAAFFEEGCDGCAAAAGGLGHCSAGSWGTFLDCARV